MLDSNNYHTKPPEHLRVEFKRWQKASIKEIDASLDILDFNRDGPCGLRVKDGGGFEVEGVPGWISSSKLREQASDSGRSSLLACPALGGRSDIPFEPHHPPRLEQPSAPD